MKRTITQKGFSTVELMIAFAIIMLALTGVIVAASGNQNIALDTEMNNLAIYKTEERLEDAFAEQAEIGGFAALNSDLTVAATDDLTVAASVLPISECVKEVQSAGTWWQTKVRPQDISFNTVFTSLDALEATGNNCDAEKPASDWDNPETFGEYGPQGLNINPTALDVVRRDGKRLVLMTSLTNPEMKEDFFVVDATDPEDVTEISRINAGGCRDTGSGQKPCGLTDVVVANGYAYVTSASSTKTKSSQEVEIIDIGNLGAPFVTNSVTLNITPDCTNPNSATCPGGAQTIAYHSDRIYVGTHRIGGNEFFIINANPGNPQILDSINVNRNVNDVVVWGNYAYLATSDDGSGGGLMIYYVGNDTLALVGSYSPPGDADATAIYLLGEEIYLGRERDSDEDDLFIIDVSNPAMPTLVGSQDLDEELCQDESNNQPKACLAGSSAIEGISVRGNLVFLVASQPTTNFQIWERVGDSIEPVSACNSYNYAEKAVDIDFFENLGFVGNESTYPLRIVHDKETTCSN